MIGVMAAAVYVSSAFLQIPIPTAIGNTRIHMGNVMCILSGLLLGPLSGGLAAGFGSMLFDLLNPLYITSAPFTFAFKFIMAWLCGIIAHSKKENANIHLRYVLGAVCGSLSYVVLYLSKGFIEDRFILGHALELALGEVATKSIVSLVNAIVAVAVAVPLSYAIRPILKKFNI